MYTNVIVVLPITVAILVLIVTWNSSEFFFYVYIFVSVLLCICVFIIVIKIIIIVFVTENLWCDGVTWNTGYGMVKTSAVEAAVFSICMWYLPIVVMSISPVDSIAQYRSLKLFNGKKCWNVYHNSWLWWLWYTILQQLHWLPVRERVIFIHALLVFKALHGLLPPYLADDCQLLADTGRRQLLSSDVATCSVLRTHSSLGDRCFAVAGPRTWNSLPIKLRQPDLSLEQFRRLLKTHLFS